MYRQLTFGLPRTRLGNAQASLALRSLLPRFNQTLKKGFEGINGKMNDYNAFIQANTNVVKVYVPKSVRLNGGSVLAPYQITRGSLPSIAMSKNGSNVLVSDLNLGSLVIKRAFPPSRLGSAQASLALHSAWRRFYGQQTLDSVTSIPRARIYGFKVMLNPGDSSLLWDVVSQIGFSSVPAGGSGGDNTGGGEDEPGGDDH